MSLWGRAPSRGPSDVADRLERPPAPAASWGGAAQKPATQLQWPAKLRVGSVPSNNEVFTNKAYVAPNTGFGGVQFLQFETKIFNIEEHRGMEPGELGLNKFHRQWLRLSPKEELSLQPYSPEPGSDALSFELDVEMYATSKRGGSPLTLDAAALTKHLLRTYAGQALFADQVLCTEFQGERLSLGLTGALRLGPGQEQVAADFGLVQKFTTFTFRAAPGGGIAIKGQKAAAPQLFKEKNVNFERLGIGGLDAQFRLIFRRAFQSRVLPPALVEKLGVRHVKGMLLHGPPGTGKTLIARQIGKMLNGKEPKVVNGPEVLNKFVGASEENIRNLFKDAEADQAAKGDESELHIIIFDEIDAICKSRGSARDGTGVGDSVVNQLLTKIDGVDALNNILLIGMTNRKDMLDEALLRPGRLEVQIEIGLPDEGGRQQILKIHTSRMSQNSFLGRDVDLGALAARTKNYSGAELEGLVKAATSHALERCVSLANLDNLDLDEGNVQITMPDFERALGEVRAAFGAGTELLERARPFGMIACGGAHRDLKANCEEIVQQVRENEAVELLSLLLEGPKGSGKTALAATLGMESGLPFVKLVSPKSMVGYSEQAKAAAIIKVFEDAYKSPLSLVVLDNLEGLFEYVDVGPRFSNSLLQVLQTLVTKEPPQGHRLLVIGTTSAPGAIADTGLRGAFREVEAVPRLRRSQGDLAEALGALGAFRPGDVGPAAEALAVEELGLVRLLDLVNTAQTRAGRGQPIPLPTWAAVLQAKGLAHY